MAHNFLYSGDRKYIESPLKPAPAPIVTSRQYTSKPPGASNTSDTTTPTTNTTSNKKKYANGGLKTPDSPTRSRSATKELILPPDDTLMCKPEFSKPLPQELTINDGEQLVLTCNVKGDPEPQIAWSKNGKSISSSDIMALKYRNGVATLTIHELFPEDEGIYACIATNSIGSIETKCKLSIKRGKKDNKRQVGVDMPPKIVSHLESRFVNDGETVTLACRIIGAANFDVIWLHNNKEIKPSKDFQYSNEANIYKLQIGEIFPEDGGTYTCEAFNDAGECFSTCTINVQVPGDEIKQPLFKKFPLSVSVQEGESATFSCELAEEPLNLFWLKDGKPVNETTTRYSFTKDALNYTFNIMKCTLDDVGQYQAKAVGKKHETLCAFSVNVFANDA